MKSQYKYLYSACYLLLGGLIYILFRTTSLKMFSWFEYLGILETIMDVRKIFKNVILYEWIIYSLPDGLWLFSYVSLIITLWNNEIKSGNLFWLFGLPSIVLLTEIGQSISIIPGTFDWIDLYMYLIGFTIPFIINKKTLTIKF